MDVESSGDRAGLGIEIWWGCYSHMDSIISMRLDEITRE